MNWNDFGWGVVTAIVVMIVALWWGRLLYGPGTLTMRLYMP